MRTAKAALAAAAIAVLAASCQVQSGHPHACDGHGGTRSYANGWYYCNDGTRIPVKDAP